MITKYEKANKGKLLVAVLALFVVLAGAAVVFSDSEVNAETLPSASDYTSSTTVADNGNYKVTGEQSFTISGTPAYSTLNFYLMNGATFNLSSTVSNFSGTINVYATDGTDYDSTNSIIITDMTAGAMSVVAAYDSTGSFTVSGTATATTITVTNATSVGSTGFTYTGASTIDNLVYGVEFKDAGTTNSVFKYTAVGTNAGTITLTDGDTVTVKDGIVTVSQYVVGSTNTVEITADATATPFVVTATDDAYPAFSGGSNKVTVTITNGVFGGSLSGPVLNGVISTASSGYYTSQIVNTIDDVTVTSAKISGTVTQKAQVGNTDVLKTETTGIALTINNGATLIINENVSVYVESVTCTGDIKLYGSLYTATSGDNVKGVIGPNGYTNGSFTGTCTNIVSGSGQDYYIYGIPSSPSVGDAIVSSTLTIPEGTTFTITGDVGLQSNIQVNGTLVIDSRASIYGTGSIVLGAKGTIDNNGTIGKMMPVTVSYNTQSIQMQGVSGVSFAIDKNLGMTVSGDITATSGAKANNLAITSAVITGDFTTAKKVVLTIGSDVTVAKNATVVINGSIVAASGYSFTIGFGNEGASITVNGAVTSDGTAAKSDEIITATVGLIKDDNSSFETGSDDVKVVVNNNITGYTLYAEKVAVPNTSDNSTDYYLRAYVNGALADINDSSASITINNNGTQPVYIAADETLTATKNVAITIDNVVIEGTIVFNDDSAYNPTSPSVTDYIGATYTVETTGESSAPVYTYYYTTLAAAMDAIETANDDGVTAYVNNLDINVTVADGQFLTLNVAGTISQNAILTVENGGTLEGTINDVEGKMVVQVDADSVTPQNYDVMSTSEDQTVTYAGIGIAIAEAQPGDKIAVGTAQIGNPNSKQNLTIPQGVEVTVSESMIIYGDLTVSQEATLVGGTVNMALAGSKVTVNGTLDMSEGDLTGTDFTLTSTGSAIFNAAEMPAKFNGAYYQGEDGNVITSVANAVAYAAENEVGVTINGKVSETADLTVDGVNITLAQNAEVALGNVTLSGATINADNSGALLTATISGMNGEGDAAVSGTVSVNKSNLTIIASEYVNAAGTTVYGFTINDINGTMAVQSGTVNLDNSNLTVTGETKFTVATGAILFVAEGKVLTVNGSNVEFTVEGTLDVEGSVAFTNGKSVINGTANIHGGNGEISASVLVINGTVNVSAADNDDGTFEVANNGVAVGDEKKALGSTGSIVGIIGFTSPANYIIAYAGTDMSSASMANDAEFETTAFYVNGELYATVYAQSQMINNIISNSTIQGINGIKDNGTVTWADADGNKIDSISSITIGNIDAVYATAQLDTVAIKVSVGSQISLYIDNVKYSTGDTVDLTLGTHTVTATVNPGYTGDVTISFNGQTVTGGTIEITADTAANTILSAIGNISVDTGAVSTGDDGMGIVEILLVILVVVVVILAIIVVLRMMRS